VCDITLKLFLILHFILPLIFGGVILVHLVGLHLFGSLPRVGAQTSRKVLFFTKFFMKDSNLLFVYFCLFLFVCPIFFIEDENFLVVDLISSPLHIKPEWYFLFLYCLLRRVPSKLNGVLIIGLAVVFFMFSSFFWGAQGRLKYKIRAWGLFL